MDRQPEEKKDTKRMCLGILAHVDAGKTTLSEAVLYTAGKLRRLGRVDSRDSYLDNYEVERARGITVFSKEAGFLLGDTEVTLLDTPGHVDFSAEAERTLQVLDCAVLVVSGADGVQGHTATLWRLLARYRIPTFLFINKMDQPGTNRESLMLHLRARLSADCVDFSGDGSEKEEERGRFREELALCDEDLLERCLAGEEFPQEKIRELVAARRVFPCCFGSALKLWGVDALLAVLARYAPVPDYGAEFGAKVYKISRDGQGNRLTHMKITGGSLKVRSPLPGTEEKVNQIRLYSGSKYQTVPEALPGMICAVMGPAATYPGQGLGAEKESECPVLEPVLSYRVLPPPGCDAPVMLKQLRQLEEEEPLLHVAWNENTHEIQVQVMGPVQIEILKGLIKERFGVEAGFGAGHIVYKETLAGPVEGVGHFEPLRHYAEVHLWMEPAERGTGIQLSADCREDILDRNWQRLVLTHLAERIHRGTCIGAELTDVKITLIAGRAHVKHTEGGDFRQATYRAVRQGLREAGCRILEPYYRFRLELPAECVGRAMTDLERRDASFETTEADGELSVLTGRGPAAALWEYPAEVAAYTKGRGHFSCALCGYELCHNEEEVRLAYAYDPDGDPANPTGSVFCAHGAGFVVPWDQVKQYMQVESLLAPKPRAEESPRGADARAFGGNGGVRVPFGAEDRELEAIFTRTYGERKQGPPQQNGRREVVFADGKGSAVPCIQDPVKSIGKPGYLKKEQTGLPEYLLVDGYNLIHAWPELAELAKTSLDGARHRLMDILCNYQGYRRMTLILVFDAYRVSGNLGQAIRYHNIHVVYTKEAETADQYIEKLAHEMGRRYRVTVATSDGLEQLIIRGQGCLLMSAKELMEDVTRTDGLIAEEKEKLEKPGRAGIFAQADGKLAAYLEDVRLGKKTAEKS